MALHFLIYVKFDLGTVCTRFLNESFLFQGITLSVDDDGNVYIARILHGSLIDKQGDQLDWDYTNTTFLLSNYSKHRIFILVCLC